jgi:hypothetical protein
VLRDALGRTSAELCLARPAEERRGRHDGQDRDGEGRQGDADERPAVDGVLFLADDEARLAHDAS